MQSAMAASIEDVNVTHAAWFLSVAFAIDVPTVPTLICARPVNRKEFISRRTFSTKFAYRHPHSARGRCSRSGILEILIAVDAICLEL